MLNLVHGFEYLPKEIEVIHDNVDNMKIDKSVGICRHLPVIIRKSGIQLENYGFKY